MSHAGRIVRIVGSVVDVVFPADPVPPVGHGLTTGSVEETVRGFREIVEGRHDEQPEDAFILVGGIDAMSEKAARTG